MDYDNLKELPAHIHPLRGRVSLIADFDHAKNGLVNLYLINSTKKPVAVPRQDGDLYCKREVKAGDGQWRRCDSHSYSWCGNSYHDCPVASGGFFTWQQVLESKKGRMRPVRFRIFNQLDLNSNEGVGKVADEEIEFCRFDAMAMSSAPFEDVAAVATGEVQGSQGSSLGDNTAIPALARFAADPRMFPVLKRAVKRLVKQKRTLKIESFDYDQCLEVLDKAKDVSVNSQECWNYVTGFVNDPHFPWSDSALRWLVSHYPQNKAALRTMMEGVLTKPGHPAMSVAMYDYADVAGREAALLKLDTIAEGEVYSAEDRETARDVKKSLLSKREKE